MKCSDTEFAEVYREYGGDVPRIMQRTGMSQSATYARIAKLDLKRLPPQGVTAEDAEPSIAQMADKEKLLLQIQALKRQLNGAVREKALCDLIIDILREEMAVMPNNIPFFKHPPTKATSRPEPAVLVISDMHSEKQDKSILERQLESLYHSIVRIMDILRHGYIIKELFVLFAGDLTDGETIFPGQAWETAHGAMHQIYQTALPLLMTLLKSLAQHFEKITCVGVPGNHGRVGRHNDKKTNWDTILYHSLQFALKDCKNVTVLPSPKFYSVVPINGVRFLVIHGNQIKMHQGIPYYGMERAASKWAQTIPEEWDIVVFAHFHKTFSLWFGTKKGIGNGSFPTEDEWALEELKEVAIPRQQFFGVHPDHGITWHYELDMK